MTNQVPLIDINTNTWGDLITRFNNLIPLVPDDYVKSVEVSVPTGFSTSGGPITDTGTIDITYSSGYTGYTIAERDTIANLGSLASLSPDGTPGIGTFLRGDGRWAQPTDSGGTVTSVGLTPPVGMSVNTSTITNSGTFILSYASGYSGYTISERDKLAAIGVAATANQPDAFLLSRGNHTGVTSIAGGGTGGSTATTARNNLGLGTTNQPQFSGINVGHASDTTITRISAGNIAVEGNYIYRVGGNSVSIADGGTGASTVAVARSNLGLGTAATQDIGTSGNTVPLLNVANTWASDQAFNNGISFSGAASSSTNLSKHINLLGNDVGINATTGTINFVAPTSHSWWVNGTSRMTLNNNGVLTLTNSLMTANGSPSGPTHSFTSDSGTGMYRVDTGVLGFTTGGIFRASISSAGIASVGGVSAYSDVRLKSNIKTIENALEKVRNLRGVSFDMNDKRSIGVIAQEIIDVVPEVVVECSDKKKTLAVEYGNIVAVLIEALKESDNRVTELEDRLNNIEELVGKLTK